jgi:hypothetical protein
MAFVRPEPTGTSAIRPVAWKIEAGGKQLGFSRSKIYREIAAGKVKTVLIFGSQRIPDTEIQRLASDSA